MRLVAYKGRGRQPWRWRLVAGNGRIVADSAEGYASKANLTRAVRRFCAERGLGRLRVIWR